MGKLFLILKLYTFVCVRVFVQCKEPLYVGALVELTNNWYEDYVKFFVNIWEHVFEEIDIRTDILGEYSLQLIVKDTEAQSGLSGRRLFELMNEEQPIIGILGPTLSPELTVVGQIAPFYDVIQISYLALTSSTVERKSFPTLFQVNHILDNLNPLRIKMLQYFNWTRVGTIFFQSDIEVSEMVKFHDLLKQYNMTLVTSAIIPDDYADVSYMLARLKQYDARIIMASFRFNHGAKIFCEAYKIGLYGSNHVWILSGPTLINKSWVRKSASRLVGLNCTMEELLKATDGYLSLNYDLINPQDTETVSGHTPTEITRILKHKLSQTEYKLSMYYGWVYDSAWTLALGLNNSLSHLNGSGLDGYTNNPYYLNAIMKGMLDVQFEGLSGPVSFNEDARRIGVTYIEQNFNDTTKAVATYNQITDNLTWIVLVEQLWPGGLIPRDRFIYQRVLVAPSIPSLILSFILNTVCFCIALGFLGFNIYYRKNSHIKLSSPMMNNITIIGSIMLFVCVFISTLDYGHLLTDGAADTICMIRVWIMCFGFTSLFGALFSKTWRVHKIFRDSVSLKKTSIKDYHLFGVIGVLLLCDCILLVPWSLTHTLHKFSVVKNKQDFHNTSVVISEVYTYCYHPYENYWYVAAYIYKGLLLAFGVFLAWETRHVTVEALNDSKYIGFCIYNVVIVCVFGVPLAHALPTEQTTLNFVLLSSLVLFCTTLCLCILFIPKIKLRNKVSDKFLNSSLNSTTKTTSAGPSGGTQSKDMDAEQNRCIEELKAENNRLRMEIAAETIAMAHLKRDILQFTGNVHFYKDGDKYVVFKAEEDTKQLDRSDHSELPPLGGKLDKETMP